MFQTLTVSDTLYEQLQRKAHDSGFDNLEEFLQKLLKVWQAHIDELRRRQETVRHIDALRERLLTKYGEMQDSVELIRADRER